MNVLKTILRWIVGLLLIFAGLAALLSLLVNMSLENGYDNVLRLMLVVVFLWLGVVCLPLRWGAHKAVSESEPPDRSVTFLEVLLTSLPGVLAACWMALGLSDLMTHTDVTHHDPHLYLVVAVVAAASAGSTLAIAFVSKSKRRGAVMLNLSMAWWALIVIWWMTLLKAEYPVVDTLLPPAWALAVVVYGTIAARKDKASFTDREWIRRSRL